MSLFGSDFARSIFCIGLAMTAGTVAPAFVVEIATLQSDVRIVAKIRQA